MEGCCEHGNELSVFIKGEKFLDCERLLLSARTLRPWMMGLNAGLPGFRLWLAGLIVTLPGLIVRLPYLIVWLPGLSVGLADVSACMSSVTR